MQDDRHHPRPFPQPFEALEPRVVLSRTSPFDPAEAFSGQQGSPLIVDVGPDLDTGCTFKYQRPDGRLRIDLTVDRVIPSAAPGTKLTLKLPAWDVDRAQGEVDVVYFVDKDGVEHLIGEMDGSNNTWHLNSFQIDADWLDSATVASDGTITPGRNTVVIAIDTQTSGSWCTSIDWIAVEAPDAPLPVLLVHGILSGPQTWEGTQWITGLQALGIPVETISLDNGNLALGSISANARAIEVKALDMIARYGTEKINIVSHSKGGLDSRHFAEYSGLVDTLIQLDTPNAGSAWASVVQSGMDAAVLASTSNPLARLALKALVESLNFALPAGRELTPGFMRAYNQAHGLHPDTRYFAAAADYTWTIQSPYIESLPFGTSTAAAAANALFDTVLGGPNSLVVAESSVFSIPGIARALTLRTSGADTAAWHTEVHRDTRVVNALIGLLTQPAPAGNLLSPITSQAQPNSQSGGTWQSTAAGELAHGRRAVHEAYVDTAGMPVEFVLLHGDGDFEFVIESPTGQRYNASGPGVSLASTPLAPGVNLKRFAATGAAAEAGAWRVILKAIATSGPNGREGYILSTLQELSSIALDAGVNRDSYRPNQPILLTARLTDAGSALLRSDVQARIILPDGTEQVLRLYDNGRWGDDTKNDGVYTALYEGDQTGVYALGFVARGPAGTLFVRTADGIAIVRSDAARLADDYRFNPVDTNANGLADVLRVKVPMDLGLSGEYRIVASLVTPDGVVLDTTSRVAQLQPGRRNFVLDFEGRRIFASGQNGQFTLRVEAYELQGAFPVAVGLAEVRTQELEYLDFERDPVRARGSGEFLPVDADLDGRFDWLDVELDFAFDAAGSYQWAAELLDSTGAVVARADRSGFVSSGSQTLTLRFNGTDIWASDRSGPYRVGNIVVVGPRVAVIPDAGVVSPAFEADAFESPTPQPEAELVYDGQTLQISGGLVDFGALPEGDFARRRLRLTNTGSATLEITSAAVSAGFILTRQPPAFLAPGASVDLVVVYVAEGPSQLAGTLELRTSDRNEGLFTIDLLGSKVAPVDPTGEGFTPLIAGVSNERGESVLVATDASGTPRIFLRRGGTWTEQSLNASLGDASGLLAWVDPKDGSFSIASAGEDGLTLFSLAGSTWTQRNLTVELPGATALTGSLTQFTSIDGRVLIAGVDTSGDVVLYEQTGAGRAGSYRWRFTSITDRALAPRGLNNPAWTGPLFSFVTPWNALNFGGLDNSGRLIVAWTTPASSVWNLADLTGQTALPALEGSLTAYVVEGRRMTIAGLTPVGELWITTWTPDSPWTATNLTSLTNAPTLTIAGIGSFVTSWNAENLIATDAQTGHAIAFWRSPASRTWQATDLTTAARGAPFGIAVASFSSAIGEISVAGLDEQNTLGRYWWQPDQGWRAEIIATLPSL